MSDDSSGSRLPPPAFPPGSRRHLSNSKSRRVAPADLGGALISPNDPIPSRDIVTAEPGGMPQFATESGVVTGMDMDDHMDADELASGGDPYVMDLVQKVGKLAEALRVKGEAGLRSSPDMDKFEATLRGYCVGYLAGRRAEDDPSSDY